MQYFRDIPFKTASREEMVEARRVGSRTKVVSQDGAVVFYDVGRKIYLTDCLTVISSLDRGRK